MKPPVAATVVDRTSEVPFHRNTANEVGRSMTSIIHVTSWLSRRGGGIPPVISALARETHRRGYPCSVLGLKDEWMETDWAADGVPFAAGLVRGPQALGFSPALNIQLCALASPSTVVHSHGLWMYPGAAARKYAANGRHPLIVSPHGMLEPWALNRSRWKKKLAGWWFEDRNLREADCLHALCAAEAENFRRYGLKNPIAVIPNGVDLVESDNWKMDTRNSTPVGSGLAERFPVLEGRCVILFLSRLHPKKGLSNLLQAWQKMARDFKDWRLLVAGAGEPAYEHEVKNLVRDYGLEKGVVFAGPVYGDEKRQILAGADAFVLPSFSEGFSVAVLEAAAAGLPVLLTPECNFPELVKAGAALEISPGAPAIEDGLRQMLKLSAEARRSMGWKGMELVRQSYTWPAIAGRMCRVYEWLEGNGPRPEDVAV
jgi:glycosyltransferase involved in cell wall biosynthesis